MEMLRKKGWGLRLSRIINFVVGMGGGVVADWSKNDACY